MWKINNIVKLELFVIIPGNIEVLDIAHVSNLKYSLPKNIPIAFRNGCNYFYHFIIKQLTEEFENQFTCLGENTVKYITHNLFSSNRKRSYKNW